MGEIFLTWLYLCYAHLPHRWLCYHELLQLNQLKPGLECWHLGHSLKWRSSLLSIASWRILKGYVIWFQGGGGGNLSGCTIVNRRVQGHYWLNIFSSCSMFCLIFGKGFVIKLHLFLGEKGTSINTSFEAMMSHDFCHQEKLPST